MGPGFESQPDHKGNSAMNSFFRLGFVGLVKDNAKNNFFEILPQFYPPDQVNHIFTLKLSKNCLQ